MTDHLQFGEYYRSFLMITTFLKSKNRISDRECSGKFFEGLHHHSAASLADYLRIKDPSHHVDDSWDLHTLYISALFVLSNRNGGSSAATARAHLAVTPAPGVKTEVFDASSIGRYLANSDVFLNKMRALVQPAAQGPRQPPHFHAAPHFAQPQQANFGHYPQASAFGHFSQGNQNSFSQQPHANNFSQPARAQTNVSTYLRSALQHL